MSNIKYLNQGLVTRFALRRALKNRLDKWLEEKRETILQLIDKGYRCPKSGPYVLVPSPTAGNIAWKKEFENYLTVQFLPKYGDDEKIARLAAMAELEEIAKNADRTPTIHLLAEKNPLYRKAESTAAQVA